MPRLRERLGRALALLTEFYRAPYRQTMAREARRRDDVFMMLVFAEQLGVPNPARALTLELMPVLYEDFHDWHVRMGHETSPLDHIRCC